MHPLPAAIAAAAAAMLPARPLARPCLRALRLLLRQQLPGASAVRRLRTGSPHGAEALASAPLDGAPKEYSPKVQQLVQDIASLTLLEISDLNELLKKTLKIQDMGLMPMGGMMPPTAMQSAAQVEEEEEVVKKPEKIHFTVKLTEAKAVEKVKLIKEVKNCMQGLNLVQAWRRNWSSRFHKKSRPTCPKRRRRRSRPRWKPQEGQWFWSDGPVSVLRD